MSEDSGETWAAITSAGSKSWWSVASSSDGTRLIAGVYNGYLYKSIDTGATWTPINSQGQKYWGSLTSSADGMMLAATDRYLEQGSGNVHRSLDSGTYWDECWQLFSYGDDWGMISTSSDGTRLASYIHKMYICTALNPWSEVYHAPAGKRAWKGIMYSPDGSKIAAIVHNQRTIFIYSH